MYGVQRTANLAYGSLIDQSNNSNQLLDLYQPIGASGNRPCIVFIHGGGWNSGGKGTYDTLGPHYAALGYVCASLNYRWTANAPTAATWPAQIGDCQLAVRWLRANASSYGIDTARFISYGDSAGSHLCVYLAVYAGIHSSDQSTLLTGYSSQVQVVIDQFGPADIAKIYSESAAIGVTAALDLMNQTTPTSNPSGYADASPTSQVTGACGPMLITQGTGDTTVPQDQSQGLYAALQAHNSPVTYISYAAGHEYAGLSAAQVDTIKAEIQTFIRDQCPVS